MPGGGELIQDPEAAAARMLSERPDPVTQEWRNRSDRLATELEQIGQAVVAEYGIGDQFPDDERKLKPADFERAERAFKAAHTLRPDDISLEIRESFCGGRFRGYDRARWGEARGFLERGLVSSHEHKIDSYTALLENALGVIELESARFGPAIDHFNRAVAQAPRWAYPRHNLALAYIERGDEAAAEQVYRYAIARTPYYPYLHYNLALVLHRTNRLSLARDAYQDAIKTFKNAIGRFETVASEGRNEGRSGLARDATSRAEVYRRNEAEAHNSLGTLLESQGDAGTEAEYRKALSLNNQLYPAAQNLAQFLQKSATARDPNAISDEAISLLENNKARFEPSRLTLGELRLKQRKFDDAEREFRAAQDLGFATARANLGLGRALLGKGDLSAAKVALQQALAIEVSERRPLPGRHQRVTFAEPLVYESLGDVLDKQGDHAAACREYRQAQRSRKKSPDSGDHRELDRKVAACPR